MFLTSPQVSEKAISYFERASLMQPDDVKWQLMIASCYRRSGNYHRALETYKSIHRKFPENIECLKFLGKKEGNSGVLTCYATGDLTFEMCPFCFVYYTVVGDNSKRL